MPYITLDDYLDRFGEPETIRITDTTKAGAVDVDKVDTAIAEAGQFADSYLAARYTLPFVGDTPEILKGIIAALAREKLHKSKMIDQVRDEADRARSQLKDIAAGRATLMVGGDSSATPPENPASDPRSSWDRRRRVFTNEALNDYTNIGCERGWRNGPLG